MNIIKIIRLNLRAVNHTERLHCSKTSITATPIPVGPCSSIVGLLLNANALVCGIRVHAHEIIIKLHLGLLFRLSVIVQDGLETVVCVKNEPDAAHTSLGRATSEGEHDASMWTRIMLTDHPQHDRTTGNGGVGQQQKTRQEALADVFLFQVNLE